jgi:hypothetical protein
MYEILYLYSVKVWLRGVLPHTRVKGSSGWCRKHILHHYSLCSPVSHCSALVSHSDNKFISSVYPRFILGLSSVYPRFILGLFMLLIPLHPIFADFAPVLVAPLSQELHGAAPYAERHAQHRRAPLRHQRHVRVRRGLQVPRQRHGEVPLVLGAAGLDTRRRGVDQLRE